MKVLIVEDDLPLSDVLAFTLRRAGFVPFVVHDGLSAIQAWSKEPPDLVVLDLNLPEIDGFGVCRHIRRHGNTPIIILSVQGSDEAVVRALDLGADDYIVKPFSPGQLVARARAVLRRAGIAPTPGELAVGALALDRARSEVQVADGAPMRLTPLELKLLETLMSNPDRVLPADTLIAAVWGPDGGDRTMLKQLVYRLRSKLETGAVQSSYIETVAGVGYELRTLH